MEFSVNRCGVMHIRKRNLEFEYQMNDSWVKSVDEERGCAEDLWIKSLS